MKDNLVLIGMMGCGKSTVGALLAQRLGRTLVDTDPLIEARVGRSISQFVAEEGWEAFRDEERKVSATLARQTGLVIACGGGLPLNPDSIGSLKESGTVFWLNRDPGETYDHLDTTNRPLAQQGREAFLALYAQREPRYRACADHIITAFSSPEATVNAILEVLP